jgi:hypothetical protein
MTNIQDDKKIKLHIKNIPPNTNLTKHKKHINIQYHCSLQKGKIMSKLQQSKNWKKRKLISDFLKEGFPFDEGMPVHSIGLLYNIRFEIITQDGRHHTAIIEYKNDEKIWYARNEYFSKEEVIAWQELPEKS